MPGHDEGDVLVRMDPDVRGVLRELKEALKAIAGEGFRLILFGSRARGDAEADSDVDLMVILPDERYTVEARHLVRDRAADFALRDGYVFNVVVTSESIAREHEGFEVYGAVEREGVPV